MKKTSLLVLLLLALLSASDWAWMSSATAQPAGNQRGGFMAQRERLVTSLQLDIQQQARLDAITSEMLPKYLATSGMDPAERTPARAKLSQELQQKVNAMLTPDQRAAYELMQARKEEANAKAKGATAPGRDAASAAAGS
jgi:hypothetical protein